GERRPSGAVEDPDERRARGDPANAAGDEFDGLARDRRAEHAVDRDGVQRLADALGVDAQDLVHPGVVAAEREAGPADRGDEGRVAGTPPAGLGGEELGGELRLARRAEAAGAGLMARPVHYVIRVAQ